MDPSTSPERSKPNPLRIHIHILNPITSIHLIGPLGSFGTNMAKLSIRSRHKAITSKLTGPRRKPYKHLKGSLRKAHEARNREKNVAFRTSIDSTLDDIHVIVKDIARTHGRSEEFVWRNLGFLFQRSRQAHKPTSWQGFLARTMKDINKGKPHLIYSFKAVELTPITYSDKEPHMKVTVTEIASNEQYKEIYRNLSQEELDEHRAYAALNREETEVVLPKTGQASVSFANAVHREMVEMVRCLWYWPLENTYTIYRHRAVFNRPRLGSPLSHIRCQSAVHTLLRPIRRLHSPILPDAC
jgi:hypothetical protein